MNNIRFQIATEDGWLEEETTLSTSFQKPLEKPFVNFKIMGDNIIKARVRNSSGRWLPYFSDYVALGDGTPIIEIEIVCYNYIASVHCMNGDWLHPVPLSYIDNDTILGIACPIDGIWIQQLGK